MRILRIAGRECRILVKNPIFFFTMVFFPLFVIYFFTSMLDDGQPVELPIGVVDQDNTATSRKLIRTLDGFQSSHVVGHYPNMNEARQAMQRNEIYAFLLIPKGTSAGLMSSHQPKVSFYYNGVVMLAGNTTMKDLKTISVLGSASVGMQKLSAIGKTPKEIKTFLQPITIDLHMIGNPWANYNVYLTTTMVPGLFMLFIFLLTPYSIGTELKFGRAEDWMRQADNNPFIAVVGKLLPHTLVYMVVFAIFQFYVYHILQFPHPGGVFTILLNGLVTIIASQSFGVFIFGLMPSLRMSMSVCSLWAMLGFSLAGATYPVSAMDGMLQAVAPLFPLRHYYMIYQLNILNGFPLLYAWDNWCILLVFCILPFLVLKNIRRAMLEYKYIP